MKQAAFALASLLSLPAFAGMPSSPVSDPNFAQLPNGTKLASIEVNGSALTLTRGTGAAFGEAQKAEYLKLKAASLEPTNTQLHWVVMDLDSGQRIAESAHTDRRQFGASVSKIFVAATFVDQQLSRQRALSRAQLQRLSDMIVVSSNTAWAELQTEIGDGDNVLGRERNFRFTQRMGYRNTYGFSGGLRGMHGNELCARDLATFLYDTYHGRYAGAEYVWKIMHASRTGRERAKKYIPSSIFLGGKTGTYDGPTQVEGKDVQVRVRHQVLVLNVKGREYAIVVLANTGSEETAALMAGGLLREVIAR